jgi:hypothetical protein
LGYKNFKGSRAFVSINPNNPSRKELPFFRQENESIPMLKLVGKLIG